MFLTNALSSWLSEPYKIPLNTSKVVFLDRLLHAWARDITMRLGGYDDLTKLSAKYKTDKGVTIFPFHGYASKYHELFAGMREKEVRLLEIGLARTSFREKNPYQCPSLSLWLDYFPRAKIYGFDIDDFTDVDLPRTSIFQGDQGSRDDLLRLATIHAPFDIIIDDGSHASYHQQMSLRTLFPYLSHGGIYVIEDLNTQPESLEESFSCEYKTRQVLGDRRLLDTFINNVDKVAVLDTGLEAGEGGMGIIWKT
jgi:hypothetical protein